jgi:phosphonate transport system substrate-binding protein
MEKTYQSYIIANPKANIRGIEDLKEKTLALVDPNSTSGRLIPLYELKNKANFDLDKDIKIKYVGTHEDVLTKVLNGDFPAGAVKSTTYNRSLEKERLVIVRKCETQIPGGPIVVRGDIHYNDELRIQDALLTVVEKDPGIINTLDGGGFAKVLHEKYEFLFKIAADLGINVESFD